MTDLLSPADIEARVKRAGLSIAEICKLAGVAPSTFYRWKSGETEPTLGVYQRICDATAAAEAA